MDIVHITQVSGVTPD